MRVYISLLAGVALFAAGCSRQDQRRLDREDHSAAHAVGGAAYHVSKETEKLARKAGHELKDAGHEAHQGWKDARDRARR